MENERENKIQEFDDKELLREVTLEEIEKILSKTIIDDNAAKIISFLAALLNYTEEDQINVAFSAESSTGKSYIVEQVLNYFPSEDITYSAYSSPTAFYHEEGVLCDKFGNTIDLSKKPATDASPTAKSMWREKLHTSKRIIDWKQKIIVFLDQPHDELLQRLRPLLSHDMKELAYRVTDKNGQFGMKTKSVYIRGFPTVFFCSSKVNIGDQERSRMIVLSPESSTEKIQGTVRFTAKKLSDRDTFKEKIYADVERQWLVARVLRIKQAKIKNIVIPNWEQISERFLAKHKNLAPRTQRDFPRLIALIKAHALLNCFNREALPNCTIKATQKDVDVGFEWYDKALTSNELGLAPETYDFYLMIFHLEEEGLTKDEILSKYYEYNGRMLDTWRLERDILPALKSAGVIMEQLDENDRRVKKYIPIKGGVKNKPKETIGYYPLKEDSAPNDKK